MFKDGIRGDPLQSIMADGAADVSQGSGPGVRWFYDLAGGPKALDEGLFQHIRRQRALELHPVVTGHIGLCCCNRSRETWTAVHIAN